jgi:glyoxylase-like metal-dependent hydrolase (beta-lactamase superfamily II)
MRAGLAAAEKVHELALGGAARSAVLVVRPVAQRLAEVDPVQLDGGERRPARGRSWPLGRRPVGGRLRRLGDARPTVGSPGQPGEREPQRDEERHRERETETTDHGASVFHLEACGKFLAPALPPPSARRRLPRVVLLETFPVGEFECNCSVLGCADSKEAMVVDPGGDPERILEVVRHYDLTVRWLVHTHAHLDHIAGTRDLKEATMAPIALHRDDLFLYDGFEAQARMFGWQVRPVAPVDHFLTDGETLSFGKRSAEVLHTPGHTPGSCCFRLDDEGPLLFAGDTLFARSIGRTDLPGGDYPTIERSIRDRLYTLDPATRVVPGHGSATTIGDERRHNPFVRGLS